MKIPASCKFKKIRKTDRIYCNGSYLTNGHWMVKTDWILSLKRNSASGIIGLANKVRAAVVKYTTDKLNGAPLAGPGIERVLKQVDLREYRPLDLEKIEWVKGYFKGDPDRFDFVKATFAQLDAPTLDIEYTALLFFDSSAAPMYRDNVSPIALVKSGEVVALLMPLMP